MRHIPNILTIFRVVLIPFFVWEMIKGNTIAGGCILLISSLTDFLDGLLARRFKWTSDFGKLLDPIADKLTQTAVSIVLILRLRAYWYFFAFMIFKDFVILVFGAFLLKQGMKFKGASFIGKTSTFFFYGGMLLILFFPGMPRAMIFTILVIAVLLALISGLKYIPSLFVLKKDLTNSAWEREP